LQLRVIDRAAYELLFASRRREFVYRFDFGVSMTAPAETNDVIQGVGEL
jgi:hypothetical protein